jgi:hypothetical protein
MSRLLWTLVPLTLAAAASGCGSSSGVSAQGKVTKGGAKYAVPADQSLSLTLYSTGETKDGDRTIPAGKSYMAVFDPEEATFTVPGPDGRGIPPGKYRVSVTQKLRREAVDKKNEKVDRNQKLFDRDTDTFQGKYGESSPFVFDVDGKTELTIDLDKPGNPPAPAGAAASARDRSGRGRD